MGSSYIKETKEARFSRSWTSRVKANVKDFVSKQSSKDVTEAESSGKKLSTLSSSSAVVPAAESSTQVTSDPQVSISAGTNDRHSLALHGKVPTTVGRSNIWLKAYDAAKPDTKKWIESLTGPVTSQGIDKGDQSWAKEIVNIVKALEKKHQDSSLRVTVGQKEIALRDYVAPTVALLTMIGDISSQFAPAPSGIAWSAIKVLLQLPVTGIGETTAILAYTERILSIFRRAKVYEIVFTENNTTPELLQDLEGELIAVYAKSLDLLAHAARHLKNEYLQILEWISNPGRATSLMAELTQCETDLARTAECCEMARSANEDERHTELLLNIHNSVENIDDGMRRLFDRIESQQMLEALDYFSSVKFGEQHQKKVESRTPGTGSWLLEHSKFKEWERSDESGILWLQGTVGMGKSFLASTVIDQFLANDITSHTPNRKNNHGLAYFYCERGSVDLREPISVLRSYVRQLSIVPCYPEFMQKKLIDLYQEIRKQGAKLSINVCRDQLFESVNLYPRTTIILDGLDECDPNERGTLVELLAELVKHAKNPVKLFISSRREQDIAKQLECFPNVVIDARDNQQDIRKFVEERIERIEKTGKWISISQDLKNKIKDTLCAKSDGIWTYLQMDQLSKLRQVKQLEERLGKLPKTLNAAYEEIFQGIEEAGGGETLERAVKWVMCVEDPLTTGQILDAIRLSASSDGAALRMDPIITEETLLDICSHLIIKESHSNTWKFPHASVIEYFEQVHQWTLERAHSFVAQICLSYILDDDPTTWKMHKVNRHHGEISNELDDQLSVVKLSNEPQDELLDKNNDKLSDQFNGNVARKAEDSISDEPDGESERDIKEYVLNNWPEHVLALEKPELHEPEVSSLLKRFLGIDKSLQHSSQHYRSWVEYYAGSSFGSYTGSVDESSEESGDDMSSIDSDVDSNNGSDVKPDVKSDVKPDFAIYSNFDEYSPIENPLVGICILGFYHLLQDYWRSDIDILAVNGEKRDLLSVAANNGHLRICEKLIELGADVNRQLSNRPNHSSALSIAAAKDHTDIVKLLISHGADPNLPLQNSSSLCESIHYGSVECLKILLEAKADPNHPCGPRCGSAYALESAAYDRNIKAVKLLLESGADASLLSETGYYGSAIAAAACVGNKRVCQLLIEHGADVKASLKVGDYGSAIAAAAHGGRKGVCQLLIEQGADVKVPLQVGEYGSALAAAAFGGSKRVCRLLIEHGADANMPLKGGVYGSALAAALASYSTGAMDVIRYLIEEVHMDTTILSTSPPQEDTCYPKDWKKWGNQISEYLVEGNYVGRNVLTKIGFEDQGPSSKEGSLLIEPVFSSLSYSPGSSDSSSSSSSSSYISKSSSSSGP